ncbi:hypothetical protein DOK78_002165 [Enterococcus sp. DIV2402]|uniref:HTH merR-type domain-containing protein n=1 Tax=Candidatus Enterococcus lowellii TaxID=2230877 RepID=A0ABZ2SPQ5_9ENTE|nr:MerR family transcriptional regulator [Enterococcus sp. DIV2402]MBO0463710.1 MerR family transcriptional regulator [Enterococcus sp. DIV2402]
MGISEVAKIIGVTPVTLRYYERMGLIPPVKRKNGGVRSYSYEDIKKLKMITCLRSAGLSIEALLRYTEIDNLSQNNQESKKKLLVNERSKLIEQYYELGQTIERLNHKISELNKDSSQFHNQAM